MRFTYDSWRPDRPRNTSGGARKAGPPQGNKGDPFFIVLWIITFWFVMRLLVELVHVINVRPAEVGDTLQFQSIQALPDNVIVSAHTIAGPWAAPGRACSLNTVVMAQHGGAMVVTAVRQDGLVVAWSGGPTALGSSDCRQSTSLLLADADYESLQAIQPPVRPAR